MSRDQQVFVNRKRNSGFILVRPRHILPILAGAFCATIVLHLLGFTILSLFGIGLSVPEVDNSPSTVDRPIAIVANDEEDPKPVVKPPDEPPEVIQIEEIKPPDIEDLPLETLTMAPGETEINLAGDAGMDVEQLSPQLSPISTEKIKQGLAEPSFSEALTVTDNPIKVKSLANPSEIDPSKLYEEELRGAGGADDSNLPDGSKTLSELLARPGGSLGKGDYSRLGADLLFEYNKADLKNSAHIGLLQLAALMYKNPETIFIIEGHTDSFGSKEYNTMLSLMRANAVRVWLKKNGIDLSRVYIRPCGDVSPVTPLTGTKEQQSLNRRVEIHMRKRGEEIPAGSLPDSYEVDMSTPIAQQLAKGVALPALHETEARPQPKQDSQTQSGSRENAPASRENAGAANKPRPAENESIPLAIPVEDDIPSAVPVEEDIPIAEPL